jgi:hypothetical protein
MSMIHCRACWQPVSLMGRRCPRCGDDDKYRRRRTVAKWATCLIVAVAAAVVALGLFLR